MALIDLKEQVTFGKGQSNCKWLFQCDCGRKTAIVKNKVTGGHVTQCRGCGYVQAGQKRSASFASSPKAGHTSHPLYSTWANMLFRCRDDGVNYTNYKGRGIEVCKQWESFQVFLADVQRLLGDKPTPNHSLDRIDNDCGYQPDNIRWATKSEQNYNSRGPNGNKNI